MTEVLVDRQGVEMQAKVENQGNVVIIHLSGRVDVETAEAFRSACLNQLTGKCVIFDFKALSFVGSSGILPFLETMQDFAIKNENSFKFSSVGSEFKKVFAATPLKSIEICETPQAALNSFLYPRPIQQPIQPAPTIEVGDDEFGLLSFNRESEPGNPILNDPLEEEAAE